MQTEFDMSAEFAKSDALLKNVIKKDYYQMVKDGAVIATEARTEVEVAEQNAALESHGLTSRWVKWDMTNREACDLAVDHTICDPKVLPR